mmetsp:Transcript_34385/g.111894  ORF Transcript_34385/g.111894 Transcript_34385/m.111894 type:complete len:271 (-) Transcript_34385:2570-3382(-)
MPGRALSEAMWHSPGEQVSSTAQVLIVGDVLRKNFRALYPMIPGKQAHEQTLTFVSWPPHREFCRHVVFGVLHSVGDFAVDRGVGGCGRSSSGDVRGGRPEGEHRSSLCHGCPVRFVGLVPIRGRRNSDGSLGHCCFNLAQGGEIAERVVGTPAVIVRYLAVVGECSASPELGGVCLAPSPHPRPLLHEGCPEKAAQGPGHRREDVEGIGSGSRRGSGWPQGLHCRDFALQVLPHALLHLCFQALRAPTAHGGTRGVGGCHPGHHRGAGH